MTPRAGTAQKTRRGFNLIESAIVLGFVGLVIGGIWTAASAVMENKRISDCSRDMLFILDNTRKLLHGSADATLMSLGGGSNKNITEAMFAAGVFPKTYVLSTVSGYPISNQIAVKTPDNKKLSVLIGDWGGIFSGKTLISLSFWDGDSKTCNKLIAEISNHSKELLWIQTHTGPGFFNYYSFPVPSNPSPCGGGTTPTPWYSFLFLAAMSRASPTAS